MEGGYRGVIDGYFSRINYLNGWNTGDIVL